MKLIHSSTSMKSALVYVYLIQAGYSKGWNPIQKFSMDKKNNFCETRKYFPRASKNFIRAGKIEFCQESSCDRKSFGKNFSKKTNAF